MEIIATICNLIGLCALLLALLLKGENMKWILWLLMIGNLLVSVAYLLDGSGINAAASGFLACGQSLINALVFERRNKPIPIWLTVIYGSSFAALNFAVGGFNLYSVLAILATLCFVISIVQKNGKAYRLCAVGNTVLWITYDILTESWNGLLTHATVLTVTLIGMLIHDRKKKNA